MLNCEPRLGLDIPSGELMYWRTYLTLEGVLLEVLLPLPFNFSGHSKVVVMVGMAGDCMVVSASSTFLMSPSSR